MIKVYGIPNCGSVKKALDWLKQNNLNYEFHDYKKLGITKGKLKEWCRHFGWETVLNKNGTTFKELSEEEKQAVTNEKSAIQFLQENTSAIKRPIIEAGERYLIRFNEQEYRDTLL
jgi:arsenate reductase